MTQSSYDLILKNGTAMTPSGRQKIDVGVRMGKIAHLGDLSAAEALQVMDCSGLTILPGVIDTQVHFREPGLEYKEDLESGTRGAVMGGVTTVFEMPNTKPLTDTPEALADKLQRAKGRAWTDHAFFIGATAANAEHIAELERLDGCCGIKIFMGASTGDLLVAEDENLLRVLAHGTRRIAIHAEDEFRMRDRKHLADEAAHPRAHPEWRDAESARLASERIIRLARQTGRRIHILHITTAEEIDLLAQHKDFITMETTPQHLTLFAPDCYDRLGTLAQMNPPIRTKDHQDGLWRGIQEGVVDVIGSDHAPHTLEEKAKPYPASPSGMTGVQTLLPIMLNHVNEGRLTLERLVDLVCHGPQRIFQIAGKGRMVRGYDADFTIVDLNEKRTIDNSWIESKVGWSPFAGVNVTGWPKATIIRGQVVMQDDQLVGQPIGIPVKFQETM